MVQAHFHKNRFKPCPFNFQIVFTTLWNWLRSHSLSSRHRRCPSTERATQCHLLPRCHVAYRLEYHPLPLEVFHLYTKEVVLILPILEHHGIPFHKKGQLSWIKVDMEIRIKVPIIQLMRVVDKQLLIRECFHLQDQMIIWTMKKTENPLSP